MAPDRDRSTEASSDPEIRAMTAVTRTLRDLPLAERRRVLAWAQERFGSDEPAPDYDFARKLMNATAEVARRFGRMSEMEVILALEGIVEQHRKAIKDARDQKAVEVEA